MSDAAPVAIHQHVAGNLEATLDFLKQMRYKLRELRRAQVGEHWLRAFDVNGDFVEIAGVGFVDEEILAVLDALNAVFNRETIHVPTARPHKEFKTGKRRPWAEDRVM
jgi:hypothetical protein